ncbi:MAG: CD225/dispanin family protein [Bacteroidales bacterium]|nr:CD225/dispanin family protein [Bacteroidales bacterium]
MEDFNNPIQETPQQEVPPTPVQLPPHKNRLVFAILGTIFCCLVSGIIAIIHSAKANELYNSSLYATDPSLKQSLYLESEVRNNKARTWNIVSLVFGLIGLIVYIILIAAGVMAAIA